MKKKKYTEFEFCTLEVRAREPLKEWETLLFSKPVIMRKTSCCYAFEDNFRGHVLRAKSKEILKELVCQYIDLIGTKPL